MEPKTTYRRSRSVAAMQIDASRAGNLGQRQAADGTSIRFSTTRMRSSVGPGGLVTVVQVFNHGARLSGKNVNGKPFVICTWFFVMT